MLRAARRSYEVELAKIQAILAVIDRELSDSRTD